MTPRERHYHKYGGNKNSKVITLTSVYGEAKTKVRINKKTGKAFMIIPDELLPKSNFIGFKILTPKETLQHLNEKYAS